MEHATPSLLTAWENFYVIVGSSAAALTGLQFVVMALVADAPGTSTTREVDAFGTPTIVHFCAALLISAILSAPWPTLTDIAVALGVCGAAGVVYVGIIVLRIKGQNGYTPVFEDWLWHVALPVLAYAGIGIAAIALETHAAAGLFVAAGSVALLLFIGIHNSWDTVTYIAIERANAAEKAKKT